MTKRTTYKSYLRKILGFSKVRLHKAQLTVLSVLLTNPLYATAVGWCGTWVAVVMTMMLS